MTESEIIDLALSQGDNVPESDAAYIDRRRRAHSFLVEVVADIWWNRDWPFKKTEADITVLAGESSVAVPWNFDSIGNYGGVYRLVGGQIARPALELVPESKIVEARTSGRTASVLRAFAIYGQDPDTQVDLIQTEIAAADAPLRLLFQRQPPRILDLGDPEQPSFTLAAGALTRSGTTATVTTPTAHGFATFDRVIVSGAVETAYNGTYQVIVTGALTFTYQVTGAPATPATGTVIVARDVATANAALNEIPARFHLKVMLNGLKAKLRESKGDARWQKLEADYRKGIENMETELVRFQGEIRQMPSFFGRG